MDKDGEAIVGLALKKKTDSFAWMTTLVQFHV